MPPSDFAKADLSKVLEELTIDEAISLIAGVGFWHTHAIERLGIPAIKVSDGPNGIRGNHFLMSTPAKVLLVSRPFPCHLIFMPFVAFSTDGAHVKSSATFPFVIFTLRPEVKSMLQQSSTAMGATFDPELLHTIGLKLLAPEAKLKAASLALAPTCNIQRVCRSLMIHLAAFLTFIRSEPPWWQGVTDLPFRPSELTPSRRALSPSLRTLTCQEPSLLRISRAFKKAELAPRSSTSGVLPSH